MSWLATATSRGVGRSNTMMATFNNSIVEGGRCRTASISGLPVEKLYLYRPWPNVCRILGQLCKFTGMPHSIASNWLRRLLVAPLQLSALPHGGRHKSKPHKFFSLFDCVIFRMRRYVSFSSSFAQSTKGNLRDWKSGLTGFQWLWLSDLVWHRSRRWLKVLNTES